MGGIWKPNDRMLAKGWMPAKIVAQASNRSIATVHRWASEFDKDSGIVTRDGGVYTYFKADLLVAYLRAKGANSMADDIERVAKEIGAWVEKDASVPSC